MKIKEKIWDGQQYIVIYIYYFITIRKLILFYFLFNIYYINKIKNLINQLKN